MRMLGDLANGEVVNKSFLRFPMLSVGDACRLRFASVCRCLRRKKMQGVSILIMNDDGDFVINRRFMPQ